MITMAVAAMVAAAATKTLSSTYLEVTSLALDAAIIMITKNHQP
jgi:hypothetical protein